MEEEKLTFARKYNRPSKVAVAPPTRKSEVKDAREPRRFGISPRSNNVDKPFQGKSRFGTSHSNKWVRDDNAYCDIHQVNGHATKDCSVLKRHLADLWATGDLQRFNIEEFVQQYHKQRRENGDVEQSTKKQQIVDL